jgi:hypothetical protein
MKLEICGSPATKNKKPVRNDWLFAFQETIDTCNNDKQFKLLRICFFVFSTNEINVSMFIALCIIICDLTVAMGNRAVA